MYENIAEILKSSADNSELPSRPIKRPKSPQKTEFNNGNSIIIENIFFYYL